MFDNVYTDLNGVMHHENTSSWIDTRYIYDADKDPWLPVRRLMTCPHCGVIGPHREQGDPRKEYARMETNLKNPAQCEACNGWSILASQLNDHRRHPQGLRVDCPPYRIPKQEKEEER